MLCLLGLFASLFGCRTPRGREGTAREEGLRSLAIYYGWPSVAGGARGVEEATAKLAAYDRVVLGAGLELREHPDHASTRAIIAGLRRGPAEVYGYLALGSSTGLDGAALAARALAWRELGVQGILLDEAGHDFGTTRARQNLALEAVHRAGLAAFVNAFDPDDLLAGSPPAALRPGDSYLYESFGLRLGVPEPARARAAKLAKLEAARRRGLRLYGVSTARAEGDLSRERWAELCRLAREARLEGVGWGTPGFGAGDGKLPPSLGRAAP